MKLFRSSHSANEKLLLWYEKNLPPIKGEHRYHTSAANHIGPDMVFKVRWNNGHRSAERLIGQSARSYLNYANVDMNYAEFLEYVDSYPELLSVMHPSFIVKLKEVLSSGPVPFRYLD